MVQYMRHTLSHVSDIGECFPGHPQPPTAYIAYIERRIGSAFPRQLDVTLLWWPGTTIYSRRVDPQTQSPLFSSWRWAVWIGNMIYTWTCHQLDDVSRIEWQCTDLVTGKIRYCHEMKFVPLKTWTMIIGNTYPAQMGRRITISTVIQTYGVYIQ